MQAGFCTGPSLHSNAEEQTLAKAAVSGRQAHLLVITSGTMLGFVNWCGQTSFMLFTVQKDWFLPFANSSLAQDCSLDLWQTPLVLFIALDPVKTPLHMSAKHPACFFYSFRPVQAQT